MLVVSRDHINRLYALAVKYETLANDLPGRIVELLEAQDNRMNKLELTLLELSRVDAEREINNKPIAKTDTQASKETASKLKPSSKAKASRADQTAT